METGGLAQGLDDATAPDLATIEILANGYGLHCPTLDTDLAVPDLLAGLFGTKTWLARRAGRTSTPAKAAAARRNGSKGGRPRKVMGQEGRSSCALGSAVRRRS